MFLRASIIYASYFPLLKFLVWYSEEALFITLTSCHLDIYLTIRMLTHVNDRSASIIEHFEVLDMFT